MTAVTIQQYNITKLFPMKLKITSTTRPMVRKKTKRTCGPTQYVHERLSFSVNSTKEHENLSET